jgi:glucose-1-phosphate cytidylyltransferase
MSLYAAQGFRSFVLCLGHEGERIRDAIAAREELQTGGWRVMFADTGIDTPTGGRVARVADLLRSGTFFLTYGDGVADIRIADLLAHHRARGRAATVTVVRPRNPWGVVELDTEDHVMGFREKPRLRDWVNGGFFVLEPRALAYIGEDDVLEREPLESLARDGELAAFRHTGFWDCMDTYKDTIHLNDLWERGEAPWAEVAGATR